jgi:hypothetical protein
MSQNGGSGSLDEKVQRFLASESKLFKELAEPKKGLLRFDQTSLSASTIAGQYFCEKKVEMEYTHGRVETVVKQQGSEGHESLTIGAVKSDRAELLKKIFDGKYLICQEISFISKHEDVLLLGKPDAIVFHEGEPLILFEFKFSNSKYPYPGYHVQAGVYGLILSRLGFNVDRLYYALALIPRDRRSDNSLFEGILSTVADNGAKEARLEVNGSSVYVCKFNHEKAERDLDWALRFWRGERSATPADNLNKCRNCEFTQLCARVISNVSMNI